MAAPNNQRPRVLRRGPAIFVALVFGVPFILWNAIGFAQCQSAGGQVRIVGLEPQCFINWSSGR